jgi:hypothetical protein
MNINAMQIVIILYIGNNDKKNKHACLVQMQLFFLNIFCQWLVESTDAELMDVEG